MMTFLQGLATFDPLSWALALFLGSGLVVGISTGYLRARKIQPKGFRWRLLGREIIWGAVNLTASAFLLGGAGQWLRSHGFITYNDGPASVWIVALEVTLYFVGFDTWFYWWHRLMHKEPFYTLIHKVHHGSPSPNLLTTFSESPLESFVNGSSLLLFTAILTVHEQSMLIIAPFAPLMGLYVHSGHEFLPRWWNKTWATKWFISATFHDQHHRYFKGNYGGFTTVWDRLCGTMRPTFEADFEKVTTRPIQRRRDLVAEATAKI